MRGSTGRSVEMVQGAEERRLIEACLRGDREGFRGLYEVYGDRVWSIALNYSGHAEDASDITQRVFLKLFRSIGQYRSEAGFATWLYRLVVNECLDERRRRKRYVSFEQSDLLEEEGGGRLAGGERVWFGPGRKSVDGIQETVYRRSEISRMVRVAVGELSPKLRIAILLKHFEELTYEQMARVLGCSPGTVASRLNRGHRELARRLAHLRDE